MRFMIVNCDLIDEEWLSPTDDDFKEAEPGSDKCHFNFGRFVIDNIFDSIGAKKMIPLME